MGALFRARHDSAEDAIAYIALLGLALSGIVWLTFSALDAVFGGQSFIEALMLPTGQAAVNRLVTVALVLTATLITQTLTWGRRRSEASLRIEQARVHQMFGASPDAIASVALDGTITYANPRFLSLAGDLALGDSLIGHTLLTDQTDPAADRLSLVLERGLTVEFPVRIENGRTGRWLEALVYPIVVNDAVSSAVATLRDTTELHEVRAALEAATHELEHRVAERTADLTRANAALAEEVDEHRLTTAALKESEDRYRQLVEHSPDMVVVHENGLVVYANTAAATMLGIGSPELAEGIRVATLWMPATDAEPMEALQAQVMGGSVTGPTQVRMRRLDGTLMDVELSIAPLLYEGRTAVQCVVRDITERVRATETIHRMAYYDPLTDLPNRTLFGDRLEAALAHARRRGRTIALAFVDLDCFKAINDTLGHGVGDGVLRAVGQRLHDLLREEDTVARYSGDEFTVIAQVSDRDAAGALANRILAALREPMEIAGHNLSVTASVGVATYPIDGISASELIANADAAMYVAKEWGHNSYRMFAPAMQGATASRMELETQLRHALEREEFELHYQPQVDMRDHHLVGVEALLRWNHPQNGLLAPGEFLEVAEQAGFIGEIGQWVVRTACAQAAEWRRDGLQFGRIAVNLSAREFVQQEIVTNVEHALAASGLPPSMLELEITETIAMYNVEQILAILQLLRDMGVRVAIDDFGTGYSAMSYLKRFPIQTLKIAQAFMRDVHVDPQSAAIASMLIRLCNELDLDIVAEGVEHPSQMEFLHDEGCYVIQGHIFSEPVCAARAAEIMREGILLQV